MVVVEIFSGEYFQTVNCSAAGSIFHNQLFDIVTEKLMVS
ncbi:unnamed protein product [Macrosiphum euphorbiae]|uniref:Uncharacterized protein n=1 Tax=Macrosiphum euphorbiae TaxID=13131 RepID=A0AAV0XFN8_9HEMI|nr:unnamed protein product [Macrosiphum euphorbiae]